MMRKENGSRKCEKKIDGGSDHVVAKPPKAGGRRNLTPRYSMTQSKLQRILRGKSIINPQVRMNGNDPKPKRNLQPMENHRNKSSNNTAEPIGKSKHRRRVLLKPPKSKPKFLSSSLHPPPSPHHHIRQSMVALWWRTGRGESRNSF